MNLDAVSNKHLQELERLTHELLTIIRQAKLKDDPLIEQLRQLELQAAAVRRARFDAVDSQYHGY